MSILTKETEVKKRVTIYTALAFGIMLGYLPLSSLLFRTEVVEAQCIQFELDSCNGDPATVICDCGVGCTRLSQTQSSPLAGAYGVDTWNTVLCACP